MKFHIQLLMDIWIVSSLAVRNRRSAFFLLSPSLPSFLPFSLPSFLPSFLSSFLPSLLPHYLHPSSSPSSSFSSSSPHSKWRLSTRKSSTEIHYCGDPILRVNLDHVVRGSSFSIYLNCWFSSETTWCLPGWTQASFWYSLSHLPRHEGVLTIRIRVRVEPAGQLLRALSRTMNLNISVNRSPVNSGFLILQLTQPRKSNLGHQK